jgi:hypothetical protein
MSNAKKTKDGGGVGSTFRTVILQAKKTATGLVIPPEVVESLGAGKKPPVRLTLNGQYTYRSTVAVMNGQYMVGLSAEHRQASGIAGGDEVDVQIELDTEPRVVELPADLSKALEEHQLARKNFEALSNSNKKRLIIPITDAKTEETRKRRIDKAMETLKEGKL